METHCLQHTETWVNLLRSVLCVYFIWCSLYQYTSVLGRQRF